MFLSSGFTYQSVFYIYVTVLVFLSNGGAASDITEHATQCKVYISTFTCVLLYYPHSSFTRLSVAQLHRISELVFTARWKLVGTIEW